MGRYIVRLFPEPGQVEEVVEDAPSSITAAMRALQRKFPGDGPERIALHCCPDYRDAETNRIRAHEAIGHTRCPRCADRGTDDDRACECESGEPYRRGVSP